MPGLVARAVFKENDGISPPRPINALQQWFSTVNKAPHLVVIPNHNITFIAIFHNYSVGTVMNCKYLYFPMVSGGPYDRVI